MSQPPDKTIPGQQTTKNQPHLKPKRVLTQRERWAENWLRTLRGLPEPMYREVSNRMLNGESARRMAMWVLAQPDRGSCQNLTFNTLQSYLQVLRSRLLAQETATDRKNRKEQLRAMAKLLVGEEVRLENMARVQASVDQAHGREPMLNVPEEPKDTAGRMKLMEEYLKKNYPKIDVRLLALINYELVKMRLYNCCGSATQDRGG